MNLGPSWENGNWTGFPRSERQSRLAAPWRGTPCSARNVLPSGRNCATCHRRRRTRGPGAACRRRSPPTASAIGATERCITTSCMPASAVWSGSNSRSTSDTDPTTGHGFTSRAVPASVHKGFDSNVGCPWASGTARCSHRWIWTVAPFGGRVRGAPAVAVQCLTPRSPPRGGAPLRGSGSRSRGEATRTAAVPTSAVLERPPRGSSASRRVVAQRADWLGGGHRPALSRRYCEVAIRQRAPTPSCQRVRAAGSPQRP
jgi:hypothetical protein